MRMLGKAYLNIFHDFCFTTDHGVSQFEDRLTVQTTLAMLHCDVCMWGWGELCVGYVHCRRLPCVDKCACSVIPPLFEL